MENEKKSGDKYSKLAGNTLIFAISSFSSKLLTLIVQTCEALDDLPEAKRTCELILSKEPGFTWVRDGICPAITKKMTH